MIMNGKKEIVRDREIKARHCSSLSTYNELADQYDAWFEEQGKIIFDIEVCALKSILSGLPKPWLEIGVGSGRFAQALGIKVGIDTSSRLLDIAGGEA